MTEMKTQRISVIIPALDAAAGIAAALDAVSVSALVGECIVVDGGSADGTVDIARTAGARVITAARGRGAQLAAGARVAREDWLLFLHADTVLARGWAQEAERFIADPASQARAAAFRFMLDETRCRGRLLEIGVAVRSRLFALPYGDQGLLIGRDFHDRLGGFAALPLYEDVDIVRRIGRNRLSLLHTPAVTSAARYRRDGYLLRPLRNLCLLALYFAGVAPGRLMHLYGRS
ncbi:MAG: TIGR04283 family arsenosugar biosynthesis glycosyltransferase [Alphaproteobacteria bacterium]